MHIYAEHIVQGQSTVFSKPRGAPPWLGLCIVTAETCIALNAWSLDWQQGLVRSLWEMESWAPPQTYGVRIALSDCRKPPPVLRTAWEPILLVSSSLTPPLTHSTGFRCGHIHFCLPNHRTVHLWGAGGGPQHSLYHPQCPALCFVGAKCSKKA